MARRRSSAPKQFSRTDRIAEVIRELVASELERLGDEQIELVTVTAVKVDGSLEHADVFYSAMSAEEEGRADDVADALEELRWPIQKLINKEMSTRKTPQIRFTPDTVLSSALRIEQILRDISEEGPEVGSEGIGAEGDDDFTDEEDAGDEVVE